MNDFEVLAYLVVLPVSPGTDAAMAGAGPAAVV